MSIPTGKHNDWPWPFNLIPRSANAWESDVEPVQIWGNVPAGEHLDVLNNAGEWTVAGYKNRKIPVHFAWRVSDKVFIRLSLIRYDYDGRYYTAPSAAFRIYS